MEEITTIGLDIAKSVFQAHGIDAQCNVVVCRQLKRRTGPDRHQSLAPAVQSRPPPSGSEYATASAGNPKQNWPIKRGLYTSSV
jgi:transposase